MFGMAGWNSGHMLYMVQTAFKEQNPPADLGTFETFHANHVSTKPCKQYDCIVARHEAKLSKSFFAQRRHGVLANAIWGQSLMERCSWPHRTVQLGNPNKKEAVHTSYSLCRYARGCVRSNVESTHEQTE